MIPTGSTKSVGNNEAYKVFLLAKIELDGVCSGPMQSTNLELLPSFLKISSAFKKCTLSAGLDV